MTTKENALAITIDIPPVTFTAQPIKFDAQALEAQVQRALQPYLNTVVTDETVTGARELCATLNKAAAALDQRRKEIKADWNVPYSVFEKQINDIRSHVIYCRSYIANQVDRFDTERRAALMQSCREKLDEHLVDKIAAFKISKRFSEGISIEPLLTKARYVTPTGNPSQEAINELEMIVAKAKVSQDRYEERMAEIDRLNTLNSFDPPLTEKSFGSIIFADSPVWSSELERIVSVQIAAQNAAEARAKLAQEQHVESTKPEVLEPSQSETVNQPDEDTVETAKPSTDGKVSYVVRVDFEVRAAPNTPAERLEGAVKARLASAGFTTILQIGSWEAD